MIRAGLGCFTVLACLVLGACTLPPRGSGAVGVGVVAAERPVGDRPAANDAEAKARIHVDLGDAYLQAGNYGVALDEAKIALAAAPSYAPTYMLTAQIYRSLGDTSAARANFDEALRLAPGDPEVNDAYGSFLCATGQPQQGLERLAVAIRNPYYKTPARSQVNAGACYLAMQDDAAAEASFLRAVQLDPTDRQANLRLAEIAFRRGNFELAQRYITTVHQAGATSAASAWLGLRIERRLGNREAAASYAQQLKSRFPASPEYQLLLQGKID